MQYTEQTSARTYTTAYQYDDGDKLKMKFIKYCGGLALGISAIAGKVEGISRRKCDPESYSGYFLEFSVGVGPFSGGGDIGLASTGSGFPFGVGIPSGLSGVTEYGAGLGAGAPAGISLCYYVPKETIREPCGYNK